MSTSNVFALSIHAPHTPSYAASSPALLPAAAASSGEYTLSDEVWAEVHDSAKDMIAKMMVVDPAQRWHARDLLNHKWFEVRGEQMMIWGGGATDAHGRGWTCVCVPKCTS